MSACFCTLAIHAIYRERARLLCADLVSAPFVILTDEPSDFADLPVQAIRHAPTGPMAADYLARFPATGNNKGAAAYHDKRFAIEAALRDYDTAIFLDADSRIEDVPSLSIYPPGLSVTTVVQNSIAGHLASCGTWRLPAFQDLVFDFTGGAEMLQSAKWCHEAIFAVTKDGRESEFISVWGRAAALLQKRSVFSGEGGVIGLAAAMAGWSVDYDALAPLAALVQHEGGGPKSAAKPQ